MSSDDEIVQFEINWKDIYKAGIEKVFRIAERSTSESFDLKEFSRLYTMAYNICTSKYNTILVKCYDRLCETIRNYCTNAFDRIKQERNSQLLFTFVDEWTKFDTIILKWILKFFSYLVNTCLITRSAQRQSRNLIGTSSTILCNAFKGIYSMKNLGNSLKHSSTSSILSEEEKWLIFQY